MAAMPDPASGSASVRDLLRHTVATLAYRAEKALRDVPPEVAGHRLSAETRTPLDIVEHLGDLIEWATRMAQGEYRWAPQAAGEWQAACDRFFRGLAALDHELSVSPLDAFPADVIFQGPIADALTHVGQIALIRGVAGAPVRPESYARADIRAGHVGREQSDVRREFTGDASRRS
jgi:hypothetical protein